MKQLILILLLLGGGYYLYTNGFLNVLKQLTGAQTSGEIVQGITGSQLLVPKAAPLPLRMPERAGREGLILGHLNRLEESVFISYDAAACFGLAELVYAAGLDDGPRLIDRYLRVFTMPQERNLILTLLGKYKDKETLDILIKFYNRNTFARRALLRLIGDFKTAEALPVIRAALQDQNAAVRAEAQAIDLEFQKEAWYVAEPGAPAEPGV
ncbi:MAG: HEAT repeat domain-containing protein [Elusimicrobiota bacterium]|jgi:hypothetical protein|nr:HEAT repeat domain-containing protein [Elusimicrobiota bacterium]